VETTREACGGRGRRREIHGHGGYGGYQCNLWGFDDVVVRVGDA